MCKTHIPFDYSSQHMDTDSHTSFALYGYSHNNDFLGICHIAELCVFVGLPLGLHSSAWRYLCTLLLHQLYSGPQSLVRVGLVVLVAVAWEDAFEEA